MDGHALSSAQDILRSKAHAFCDLKLWHSYIPALQTPCLLASKSQCSCNTEIASVRISIGMPQYFCDPPILPSNPLMLPILSCHRALCSRNDLEAQFCFRPLPRLCDRRFETQALLHSNVSRCWGFIFMRSPVLTFWSSCDHGLQGYHDPRPQRSHTVALSSCRATDLVSSRATRCRVVTHPNFLAIMLPSTLQPPPKSYAPTL